MDAIAESEVLIIEPFYNGSHKQLIDLLTSTYKGCHTCCMDGTKWHWRARTSALYLAEEIATGKQYKRLFVSSVLNLAELLALRVDLRSATTVLYFHENQLVYPYRRKQHGDFQYGYNQILSCLVADRVVFNSRYNMTSFLDGITPFLNTMPDYRPKGIREKIEAKCSVLYFPIDSHLLTDLTLSDRNNTVLHIVWPHRWEHDKNPERFCSILLDLSDSGVSFVVSVLGESYGETPECMVALKQRLASRIVHWGRLEHKSDYLDCLRSAHIVLSTAVHEFFGVAVLEAILSGCYPLCPNALVYPEYLPKECLYNTDRQLVKTLKNFCVKPSSATDKRKLLNIPLSSFAWSKLQSDYRRLLFDDFC